MHRAGTSAAPHTQNCRTDNPISMLPPAGQESRAATPTAAPGRLAAPCPSPHHHANEWSLGARRCRHTVCASTNHACPHSRDGRTQAHVYTRALSNRGTRAHADRRANPNAQHMGFHMSKTARVCPIPRVTPDQRRRVALRLAHCRSLAAQATARAPRPETATRTRSPRHLAFPSKRAPSWGVRKAGEESPARAASTRQVRTRRRTRKALQTCRPGPPAPAKGTRAWWARVACQRRSPECLGLAPPGRLGAGWMR
jgi:hypothetical protein